MLVEWLMAVSVWYLNMSERLVITACLFHGQCVPRYAIVGDQQFSLWYDSFYIHPFQHRRGACDSRLCYRHRCDVCVSQLSRPEQVAQCQVKVYTCTIPFWWCLDSNSAHCLTYFLETSIRRDLVELKGFLVAYRETAVSFQYRSRASNRR